MAPQNQQGFSVVSIVILGIFPAIILKGLFDNFFSQLIGNQTLHKLVEAWPPTATTWLRVCQFTVFLILLARFFRWRLSIQSRAHSNSAGTLIRRNCNKLNWDVRIILLVLRGWGEYLVHRCVLCTYLVTPYIRHDLVYSVCREISCLSFIWSSRSLPCFELYSVRRVYVVIVYLLG